MYQQQSNQIANMVGHSARNILQAEQSAQRMTPQEAHEVLNIFNNNGWVGRIASNIAANAQQTGNWNIDYNTTNQYVMPILYQITNEVRSRFAQYQQQQSGMMQSQMYGQPTPQGYGYQQPRPVNFGQPVGGGSSFNQPDIHNAASLYRQNQPHAVPVEQQTPEVPYPRTNVGQKVHTNIETTNRRMDAIQDTPTPTPTFNVFDAAVQKAGIRAKAAEAEGLVLATKNINMSSNIHAMAVVEAMDDNGSGLKIHSFNNVIGDNATNIDSASIELEYPFTNHIDPQQVALNFLKEVPVLSQNPYYAHVIRYSTLYDIPYPFSTIKPELDKLRSFRTNKNTDMKWNVLVKYLKENNRLKEVLDNYTEYLHQVSKCAFCYTDPMTQDLKAVVADDITDIPLMLDRQGEYKQLVSTERLYMNACEYMTHVFKFIVPEKLYLSPHDPDDLKVLINRPDNGYIYRGQLLRYSDEIYIDEEAEVIDGEQTYVTTVDEKVVELLSNKTTVLRKHILLLTNIPFGGETLYGLANNPLNRVILERPDTLLECIVATLPTPIYVDSSGLKVLAGKNVDGNLTINPV